MPATKLLLQEEDRKRHLLRVWLAPQDGWELPQHFAERYHTVIKGELQFSRASCLQKCPAQWGPGDLQVTVEEFIVQEPSHMSH